MPFTKGKPKTGGRTLGTPNVVTRKLRERVKELVESRFEALEKNLSKLEPREEIVVLMKLMEFILPKGIEVPEPEPERLDFSKLTMDEKKILFKLFEKAQGGSLTLQTTTRSNREIR